jgi:Kef-type K+ transport system membrane component KefB
LFYARFHDPRIVKWQARLARVPRWAWIAAGIGFLIPIVALGIVILAVGLATGAIVLAAVLLASATLGLIFKLMNRGRRLEDGRKNVQIVVRSARVIDP